MTGSERAPDIGDDTERFARRAFDLAALDTSYCDAQKRDGTPVEVKGCQTRISEGDHSRHGRFRLWKDSHYELVEQDGEYLFVVYGQSDHDIEHVRWMDADDVSDHVGWMDYTYRASKGKTALVTWTTIFPDIET